MTATFKRLYPPAVVDDDLGVQAVPRGPPLVLPHQPWSRFGQRVAMVELAIESLHQALRQRRDTRDLVERGQPVTDAQLDRAESRVRADVPPHLADRLDRLRGDQGVHVLLECVPSGQLEGQPGGRERFEHLAAVGRKAGVRTDPVRAGRRQREEVRHVREQPVQDRDRLLGRTDAAMHMDAEDLQLAGHPLVAFHQRGVALISGDPLGRPVGHRVRARAHHTEVARLGRLDHLGDRLGQVGPGFGHRLADPGDDLDAGLQQLVFRLGMHAVAVG